MSKMVCPVCGKEFDDKYVDYLDNGNPACHSCVEKERKLEEEKENKNEKTAK